MFRLANEAQGGAKAEGGGMENKELIEEFFRGQSVFKLAGGWEQFAVRWDIESCLKEGWKIIPLDKSLLDAWDDYCKTAAKDLPQPLNPEETEVEKPEVRDLVVDVFVHKNGEVEVTETEKVREETDYETLCK